MRTPTQDDELVAGFLLSERVIEGRDDVDVIAHYTGSDDDPRIGNVINVLLKRPGPPSTSAWGSRHPAPSRVGSDDR